MSNKQPNKNEVWLYGVSQILMLFAQRPRDIRVILYQREQRRALGALLQYAAQQRLPYREVEPEELSLVTGSLHHEGVCVKTTLPPMLRLEELEGRPRVLLGLDRIGNPHNVGAILRSAAYFGVGGVVFSDEEGQARPSAAALRTAEGGGELVKLFWVQSIGRAQVELRRGGYTIIGADAKSPRSLYQAPLPTPCFLLVGNEALGLSEGVKARCDMLVSIPGSGRIDSLNVSTATAVLLAELFRG